jgi:hypothetical protein
MQRRMRKKHNKVPKACMEEQEKTAVAVAVAGYKSKTLQLQQLPSLKSRRLEHQ